MRVLNVPKNYNPEFYMFTKNGTLERFNCPKTFAMLFIFNIINIYLYLSYTTDIMHLYARSRLIIYP